MRTARSLVLAVDSIADQYIREFRDEHVLNGLDLTASDIKIVETARRGASNAALMLRRRTEIN